MIQHFTTTQVAGTATDGGGAKTWTNPSNAKVEDGSLATCSNVGPGGGGGLPNQLNMTNFAFGLPTFAVIDGISVQAKVSTTGGSSGNDTGLVWLLRNGGATDPLDTPDDGIAWTTLNWIAHGDGASLWGRAWTAAEVNHANFGVSLASMPGTGTADINIDSVQITINWHIDISAPAADVPYRHVYKVFSREGTFLGELPDVNSIPAFSQDMNTGGSVMEITSAKDLTDITTVEALLTEAGDEILTEDSLTLLAEFTEFLVKAGNSEEDALFKNSNRVQYWMYNYWYPNGKLMFSGQVNRITFSYGGSGGAVSVRVFSDGYDLTNFTARGYPFNYTTEVTQSSQNGFATSTTAGGKLNTWDHFGQTITTDVDQTNIGELVLKLGGTADVTVSVYTAPNGTLLGSIRQHVAVASSGVDVAFDFSSLIPTSVSTSYFVDVVPDPGQSIKIFKHGTPSTYAAGSMYESVYGGGSGGANYASVSGDFYFILKSGLPTTTATYSSDDPVTDMGSGILLDYNNRGGYITERDFEATGLAVTYTFQLYSILDAMKKILELSPDGWYMYVDLGTAEMDIKSTSVTPDYSVVREKDIQQLNISLTIENVKNYLLFTGGPTAGVNLYKDYQDAVSASNYGLRTATQTDNRVTIGATADAIGDTFIEENSDEVHETQIVILDKSIDITLLTPGKTVGFKNYGSFIDDLILQVVRRDWTPTAVTLTLGQLPVNLTSEIQKITRGLLNEQSLDNPTAPS